MIYSVGNQRVKRLGDCFIAPNATLIGDITLGDAASIWFNAVLRADNDPIVIGERSNVQDGCVFHTDPGAPLTLGTDVTVGHKAMLHGCRIGNFSLIGINAVVLDHARIGSYCLIGANALVTEGKEIPDYSLVMGSPGRVVRRLTDEECEGLADAAEGYVRHVREYKQGFQEQIT